MTDKERILMLERQAEKLWNAIYQLGDAQRHALRKIGRMPNVAKEARFERQSKGQILLPHHFGET